jgi:hypothetical protein
VVDPDGKLIGRLTVDQMVDFIRERAEEEALQQAGLREEEDLFASVWKSAKNRSLWLAINLMTAFIASRLIGVFEGSLEKMALLATLQSIVAGIGGNSANQTTAIIIRSIALGQVTFPNMGRLGNEGIGYQFPQRSGLGRHCRGVRLPFVSQRRPRPRNDRLHAAQSAGGRAGRHFWASRHAAPWPRSCYRV